MTTVRYFDHETGKFAVAECFWDGRDLRELERKVSGLTPEEQLYEELYGVGYVPRKVYRIREHVRYA